MTTVPERPATCPQCKSEDPAFQGRVYVRGKGYTIYCIDPWHSTAEPEKGKKAGTGIDWLGIKRGGPEHGRR
jgi:hypothetical protein